MAGKGTTVLAAQTVEGIQVVHVNTKLKHRRFYDE